jgi:mannose/fructose-specific phosphotransferase system component IIA
MLYLTGLIRWVNPPLIIEMIICRMAYAATLARRNLAKFKGDGLTVSRKKKDDDATEDEDTDDEEDEEDEEEEDEDEKPKAKKK